MRQRRPAGDNNRLRDIDFTVHITVNSARCRLRCLLKRARTKIGRSVVIILSSCCRHAVSVSPSGSVFTVFDKETVTLRI